MKPHHRPNTLKNAPLQYAPENELGVVFLFAHIAKKLQFRIDKIQPQFPDCIAFKRSGESEKMCRIEFEFKSRNFKNHRHDPKGCDCIVCWQHDWPDYPKHIEIVELKRIFGAEPNVWIQPVIKSQWNNLDFDELEWGLSKRVTPGDLLLMYRCYPETSIKDIFVFEGILSKEKASWRNGDCFGGTIKRVCSLNSPVFLKDFKSHKVLSSASFIKKNMQGNHLVSAYWHYIYEMIVQRNQKVERKLKAFIPENL